MTRLVALSSAAVIIGFAFVAQAQPTDNSEAGMPPCSVIGSADQHEAWSGPDIHRRLPPCGVFLGQYEAR